MATKRLGKGLEALIRSNSTQTTETSKLSNVFIAVSLRAHRGGSILLSIIK